MEEPSSSQSHDQLWKEIHIPAPGASYSDEVFWDDDLKDEFAELEDPEELCRLLLRSSLRGSSTRHREAIELFLRFHRTRGANTGLVAVLLCTNRRWHRATAKLIAGLEGTGLLTDAELDELADSFLSSEVTVEYPLGWVFPKGKAVSIDLDDLSTEEVTLDENAMVSTSLHCQPPLRRWAAARALRARPTRLGALLRFAKSLDPGHRDAIIHGLLDSAGVLEPAVRRRLVKRGLRSGQGRIRRAALELLCELDGPDAALGVARSDPDATVRAWEPAPLRLDEALAVR